MYGSGKLAGAVLSHSSSGIIMQFVALCAPIVPLIATPFVIKSSLNSLGSIGAKISNNGLMNFPSNKLKDNVMNKSRFADAKKSFGRYSAKKLAERLSLIHIFKKLLCLTFSLGGRLCKMLSDVISAPEQGTTPVSYTHLDVYKRQR